MPLAATTLTNIPDVSDVAALAQTIQAGAIPNRVVPGAIPADAIPLNVNAAPYQAPYLPTVMSTASATPPPQATALPEADAQVPQQLAQPVPVETTPIAAPVAVPQTAVPTVDTTITNTPVNPTPGDSGVVHLNAVPLMTDITLGTTPTQVPVAVEQPATVTVS